MSYRRRGRHLSEEQKALLGLWLLFTLLAFFSLFLIIPTGSDRPLFRKPVVLTSIIGINVAVYVVQIVIKIGFPDYEETFLQNFGFSPARKIVYTYITHMFIHGSLFHLLSNVLFLWIYGANLEDRVGRAEFLVLYLVSGVCGAMLHTATADVRAFDVPLIGASGALYGVLGTYLFLIPMTEIRFTWFLFFFFPRNIYIAAFWLIPLRVLLFDVLIVAWMKEADPSVAHWTHIGGFLAGACYGVFELLWARGRPVQEEEPNLLDEGPVDEASAEATEAKKALKGSLVADDFNGAWQAYVTICTEHPEVVPDSEDLFVLGARAESAGAFDSAIRVYRRVANTGKRGSDRARAAYRVGELLLRQYDRPEEAALVFQKILYRFPSDDVSREAENDLEEAFRRLDGKH